MPAYRCIRGCQYKGKLYRVGVVMELDEVPDPPPNAKSWRPVLKAGAGGPPPLPSQQTERANAIRDALALLEVDNDEHWTDRGTPVLKVVKELSGVPNVTQEQIRDLAPDSYLRTQRRG